MNLSITVGFSQRFTETNFYEDLSPELWAKARFREVS